MNAYLKKNLRIRGERLEVIPLDGENEENMGDIGGGRGAGGGLLASYIAHSLKHMKTTRSRDRDNGGEEGENEVLYTDDRILRHKKHFIDNIYTVRIKGFKFQPRPAHFMRQDSLFIISRRI